MASSFRSSKWDPILIIAQITSLQSTCYILLSLILYIALTLTGTDMSLDLIFSDKEIRTDTGFGWSLIIVWVVNACLSIPLLMYIVQRARQILDYVLTFHFFHLICVWKISQQFPTGIAWWLLQIVNIAIMTFGGEWACMHREMKPIMITSNKKSKKSTSHDAVASTSIETQEDEARTKLKRKTSDAETKQTEDDQGALLAAVGKAKKALMLSAGKSKRQQSKKYDIIPMKDMDDNDSTSSNHD